MTTQRLILKRASISRPDGQWQHEDYDVLADGKVVGRIYDDGLFRYAARTPVVLVGHLDLAVDPWRDERHRGDARRGDGEVSGGVDDDTSAPNLTRKAASRDHNPSRVRLSFARVDVGYLFHPRATSSKSARSLDRGRWRLTRRAAAARR
jgi:hypothetical protein